MTSNRRIVEQLLTLADGLENGSTTTIQLHDCLLGHTEAVENLPYSMYKDAQLVQAQLARAISIGRAQDIDVVPLAAWLRRWAFQVPCGPG
jgi:hypothetical protein